MKTEIPNTVIGAVSSVLANYYYSHSKLDNLFMEFGAPGEPPAGNCEQKCNRWLRRCNQIPDFDGLTFLGDLIQNYMDNQAADTEGHQRINKALERNNLRYEINGKVSLITNDSVKHPKANLQSQEAKTSMEKSCAESIIKNNQTNCITPTQQKDPLPWSQKIITKPTPTCASDHNDSTLMPKIFISHCVKDKEVADKLYRYLLLTTGLKESDIFLSSLKGGGIPAGEYFIDHIRKKLQASSFVILLLSPAYYKSQFCVSELGAAWVLCQRCLPLLFPTLKYSDVNGTMLGKQIIRINDREALLNEIDEIKKLTGHSGKVGRMVVETDQFISDIKPFLTHKEVTESQNEQLLLNQIKDLKMMN